MAVACPAQYGSSDCQDKKEAGFILILAKKQRFKMCFLTSIKIKETSIKETSIKIKI